MKQAITPEQSLRLSRMPVEYELCMGLGWLSNLRWLAGAGVIAATWIASALVGVEIDTGALYLTGVAILAYNLIFQRWLTQIQCDLTGISTRTRTLARVQIAMDWVAMTSLIHFSGASRAR